MQILLASALAALALGACATPDLRYARGSVTGRVSAVYIKTGDSGFQAADIAPARLRKDKDAERWVEVEYSRRGSDVGLVQAKLPAGEAEVGVGDVVEVKLAHQDNPRFFPVKEYSRVTRVVAKSSAVLAQDYARRLHAE